MSIAAAVRLLFLGREDLLVRKTDKSWLPQLCHHFAEAHPARTVDLVLPGLSRSIAALIQISDHNAQIL